MINTRMDGGIIVKKIIIFAISLLSLIIVPACTSKSSPVTKLEESQINSTILNYDKGIVTALENLDPKPIKGYTTAKQQKKDEAYIKSLIRDKVKLHNTLVYLKETKITKNGDKATAEMEEAWKNLEENSSAQKKDNGEMYFKVTYILVQNNNKWLIDSVNSENIPPQATQPNNSIQAQTPQKP